MNPKYLDRKPIYDARNYQKHKEAYLRRSKLQRENNPEATALYMAIYYQLNREKILKRSLEYQKTHRKERNVYRNKWKQLHPESRRAEKSRRRTRIQIDMTAEDRDISIEYRKAIANDPCFYCGGIGTEDDHYQSLAKKRNRSLVEFSSRMQTV